jgi:hypothetical protein
MSAFKTTTEYKQLLLSVMKHADLPREIIADVVAKYFSCVMLSHRWEGKEPLLYDIKDKAVYKLEAAGGLKKLQLFRKKAHQAGFHWAWVDSCCIDQHNNAELQNRSIPCSPGITMQRSRSSTSLMFRLRRSLAH